MLEITRELTASLEQLLNALSDKQAMLKYKKGQAIFSKGDSANALFHLREGRIKLVVSERGKEAVVAAQVPGSFFGEECLIGQARRKSSAIAMTDCEILRIEKATMLRALHQHVDLSEMFTAHLVDRIKRLEEDLADHLLNSSEKRLARALLLLANFSDDDQTEIIISKVSQSTLAEMIGTTRSRVNFFMNKFRKLGFIEYNGWLKINASLLSVIPQKNQDSKPDDQQADLDVQTK